MDTVTMEPSTDDLEELFRNIVNLEKVEIKMLFEDTVQGNDMMKPFVEVFEKAYANENVTSKELVAIFKQFTDDFQALEENKNKSCGGPVAETCSGSSAQGTSKSLNTKDNATKDRGLSAEVELDFSKESDHSCSGVNLTSTLKIKSDGLELEKRHRGQKSERRKGRKMRIYSDSDSDGDEAVTTVVRLDKRGSSKKINSELLESEESEREQSKDRKRGRSKGRERMEREDRKQTKQKRGKSKHQEGVKRQDKASTALKLTKVKSKNHHYHNDHHATSTRGPKVRKAGGTVYCDPLFKRYQKKFKLRPAIVVLEDYRLKKPVTKQTDRDGLRKAEKGTTKCIKDEDTKRGRQEPSSHPIKPDKSFGTAKTSKAKLIPRVLSVKKLQPIDMFEKAHLPDTKPSGVAAKGKSEPSKVTVTTKLRKIPEIDHGPLYSDKLGKLLATCGTTLASSPKKPEAEKNDKVDKPPSVVVLPGVEIITLDDSSEKGAFDVDMKLLPAKVSAQSSFRKSPQFSPSATQRLKSVVNAVSGSKPNNIIVNCDPKPMPRANSGANPAHPTCSKPAAHFASTFKPSSPCISASKPNSPFTATFKPASPHISPFNSNSKPKFPFNSGSKLSSPFSSGRKPGPPFSRHLFSSPHKGGNNNCGLNKSPNNNKNGKGFSPQGRDRGKNWRYNRPERNEGKPKENISPIYIDCEEGEIVEEEEVLSTSRCPMTKEIENGLVAKNVLLMLETTEGTLPIPAKEDEDNLLQLMVWKCARWLRKNEQEPFWMPSPAIPEDDEKTFQDEMALLCAGGSDDGIPFGSDGGSLSDDDFDLRDEEKKNEYRGATLLFSTYRICGRRSDSGDCFQKIFKTKPRVNYDKENFRTMCTLCDVDLRNKSEYWDHLKTELHLLNMTSLSLNTNTMDREVMSAEIKEMVDDLVSLSTVSSRSTINYRREAAHASVAYGEEANRKRSKRSRSGSRDRRRKASRSRSKDRHRRSKSRSRGTRRSRSRERRRSTSRRRRSRSRSPREGYRSRNYRGRSRSRSQHRNRHYRRSRSGSSGRDRYPDTRRIVTQRPEAAASVARPTLQREVPTLDVGIVNKAKFALQNCGKWTRELQGSWMLKDEECVRLRKTAECKNRIWKQEPQSHPLYAKEWLMFWEKRSQELQECGQNAVEYDYTPEFTKHWEKFVIEQVDQEVKRGTYAIYKKYGLDPENLNKLVISAGASPVIIIPPEKETEILPCAATTIAAPAAVPVVETTQVMHSEPQRNPPLPVPPPDFSLLNKSIGLPYTQTQDSYPVYPPNSFLTPITTPFGFTAPTVNMIANPPHWPFNAWPAALPMDAAPPGSYFAGGYSAPSAQRQVQVSDPAVSSTTSVQPDLGDARLKAFNVLTLLTALEKELGYMAVPVEDFRGFVNCKEVDRLRISTQLQNNKQFRMLLVLSRATLAKKVEENGAAADVIEKMKFVITSADTILGYPP